MYGQIDDGYGLSLVCKSPRCRICDIQNFTICLLLQYHFF